MRVAFVLTLLGAAVVPSFGQTTQDEICVAKDRLAFEGYFTKTVPPQVPNKTCAHDLSAYRALQAAQSPCLQGYARHSNGRCYRVVDKSQDGGPGIAHEYRITYRAVCMAHSDLNGSALEPTQTLDFCDEDGGCTKVLMAEDGGRRICENGHFQDAAGNCPLGLTLFNTSLGNLTVSYAAPKVFPIPVCVAGWILDYRWVCRKPVAVLAPWSLKAERLLDQARWSVSESPTPRPLTTQRPILVCVAGYVQDAGGVCRKAVTVSEASSQKLVGNGFVSVPGSCPTGYVKDENGNCMDIFNQ